jgi:hypothetical protein
VKPEIAIVTAYQREELLFLALEAIRREDWQLAVYVFSDRDARSDDLIATCAKFQAALIARESHAYYGNTFNLLDACDWAVNKSGPREIIHLIEDDTIIHAGYLDWARQTLRAGQWYDAGGKNAQDFAAVCARSASPNIENWYDAPCASWNADRLREAITHVLPAYFTESRAQMQAVLDQQMFPKSRYRKGGAEQDGFFLRCIEANKWKTKFPPMPLASHMGWWGYNRASHTRPAGTFEQRVEICRRALLDRDFRVKMFGLHITEREMGIKP